MYCKVIYTWKTALNVIDWELHEYIKCCESRIED